ncbi:MAG: hypothetical protein NZM00_11185, partial [Anaerolinea sp.]|nr:hypothetical protein [Anaerolinea sp.]
RLVGITETLRGLTTRTPVERAFPTREQTIAFLTDLYQVELPDDEADRQLRLYVALGLLPRDLDLRAVYLSLLGQQVAGFYDTTTQVMNVIPLRGDSVGTTLSLLEETIFVHEYTHALQDQYFDLDALIDGPASQSPDATLALLSLVEGDATAVMQVYLQEVIQRNPLAAFGLLAEGAQAGALTLPPDIPEILATELLFPYDAGLNFVVTLFEAGGWDAVNAAYASPPTTSEQILHPSKYLSGEGALPVTLPDYQPVLGPDWTPRWDTTLGQFYIREFLAAHLPARQADAAAQGWGGDRFVLYSREMDSAWALRLRWDTLAEQAEFAAALMAYMQARFGSPSAPGCWSSAEETLCVDGSESIGTLIVGAPDRALAQTLIALR